MIFNSTSRLPRHQASRLNGFVLAALLAVTAANVMAQSSSPSAPGGATSAPSNPHRGRHDPAKMQAMMAKHQADLKSKLKITAAQEGAWTSYTTAMQPPAGMGMRPTDSQRAEMDKLSTPERIDKMRAMRTERMTQMNAEMDKRGAATKALYAALTPEQQKVFDAERQDRGSHGGHGRRGDHRTS